MQCQRRRRPTYNWHSTVHGSKLILHMKYRNMNSKHTPTPVLHTFYTSAETEAKLADMYQKQVQQKQRKLDEAERKTGTMSYTALTLVKEPQREFYVMNDCVYYKSHDTFIKAPKEAEEGGGIYKLEPALLRHVELFQSRHTAFRVVFEPTMHYHGEGGACRATFYSIPRDNDDVPEILNIEDESNYEI